MNQQGIRLAHIAKGVYAVNSGKRVLVIEQAKFVVRRAGQFLEHWLKYLVGKLSTTGERIMICLGEAPRTDYASWLLTHNGGGTLYVYRLFEHMLNRLGIAKCLAIAHAALEHELRGARR